MTAPIFRPNPFAIASALDFAADKVMFKSWVGRANRPSAIDLWDNDLLNLFAFGATLEHAARLGALAPELVRRRTEQLLELGLLLEDSAWQKLRSEHPYVNLPSIWHQDAKTRHYPSYEAAYAADDVPWSSLPAAADAILLAGLPGKPGLHILDVGCGAGHNDSLFEHLGYPTWGIDISETAIRKHPGRAREPDHYEVGSVTALPWGDASFDVIVDVGCLHCLDSESCIPFLREVRRVLRPSGRYINRSFKPRSGDLLAAQPVKRDRLGFDPPEVMAMFEGILIGRVLKEGPVHVYYVATPLGSDWIL